MDIKTCECGGRFIVTDSREKEWGVYRVRTCEACGNRIRTGEVYGAIQKNDKKAEEEK